jgi:hypothetical protein
MAGRRLSPKLSPSGASYGPGGDKPINFGWEWRHEVWRHFDASAANQNYLSRWHRSREAAERGLANALAGRALTPASPA